MGKNRMKFFNFGRIGRKFLVTTSVSAIIFIIYVFFSYWEIEHQFSTNARMQIEVDELQESLHTLFESLLIQESGQRGYNLTKEDSFLDSFEKGTEEYNKASEFLIKKLETQPPNIKKSIQEVIDKGRSWHEGYGARLIALTHNGEQPTVDLYKQSKASFDDFRQSLQEAEAVTAKLRDTYRNVYKDKISHEKNTLFFISIVLIFLNVFIINRQTKSIIQPVLLLNNSVKAYTNKDFTVGIPHYKKEDELAELIQNIDMMRIELNEKFLSMESLVDLDGHTGIYNRRYFDKTLDLEWTNARFYEKAISLILFDIDFFKKYNDTFGHLEGDKCLKKISRQLSEIFGGSSDIVARFGGEEFAIILPDQSEEVALIKAETLRKAVMDLKIIHPTSEVSKFVTISVGVASMTPANGNRKPTHLISLADQALYQSKAMGRNQVTQYSDITKINLKKLKQQISQ